MSKDKQETPDEMRTPKQQEGDASYANAELLKKEWSKDLAKEAKRLADARKAPGSPVKS